MHVQTLRLFFVSLATAAITVPAAAADLRAVPKKAPPPAVASVFDWSGFYVGANGGYGTTRNCLDFVSVAGLPFTDTEGCHSSDGAVVGGQDIAPLLMDLVWKLDLPFGDAVTGPQYLLAKAARASSAFPAIPAAAVNTRCAPTKSLRWRNDSWASRIAS